MIDLRTIFYLARKKNAEIELDWIKESELHKCTKSLRRRKIYIDFPELMPEMNKKMLRTMKKGGRSVGVYEGTDILVKEY